MKMIKVFVHVFVVVRKERKRKYWEKGRLHSTNRDISHATVIGGHRAMRTDKEHCGSNISLGIPLSMALLLNKPAG